MNDNKQWSWYGTNYYRRWCLLGVEGNRLEWSFNRDFSYQHFLFDKVFILQENLSGK